MNTTLPTQQIRLISGAYRFGFGGHEKDDEVHGVTGSWLSFGDYGYDSRLGRRPSPDPVLKVHESPYAAFANSPIYILDENGQDTLVMHRSEKIENMSEGNAVFYTVTFSMIENGVEYPLSGKLLMLGNKKKQEAIPYTALNKPEYKLTVKSMNSRPDLPAIHIDGNVYIHPGVTPSNFGGCYGVSETLETETWAHVDGTEEKGLQGDTYPSVENVIKLYNDYQGQLTGDKFLLRTNSKAPEIEKLESKKATEVSFNKPTATID